MALRNGRLFLFLAALVFLFSAFQNANASVCEDLLHGLKTFRQYWIAQEGVSHFTKEKTRLKKVFRLAHETARIAMSALSPVPHPFLRTPTEQIFKRQWTNKLSSEELTPSELQTLNRYQAYDVFVEREKFLDTHGTWASFRRGISRLTRMVYVVSLLAALNHFTYLANAAQPSVREYLDRPSLGADQAQVIVESVPFPHLALRIGDKVYSYGFTHLTAKPVAEYLQLETLQERAKAQDAMAESGKQGFSDKAQRFVFSPIANQPRSVQIITLNLTDDERLKLKRDLERATAQRYYNSTFVNDCATMIVRALRRNTSVHISPLIDSSPSQIAMYFSARKALGDDGIASIDQVLVESPERRTYHLLRNIYINTMESKLFITLFSINLAQRGIVELIFSENQLQSLDPEVREAIESWRLEVANTINADPQIILFESKIQRMQQTGATAGQIEAAKQMITNYFDQNIKDAQANADDRESSFTEFTFNEQKALLLSAKKAELLLALSFARSPRLSSP